MLFRHQKTTISYALLLMFLMGCQKKPALAPAADALSAIEPPPMGATTYNDELKRELELLDALLYQGISDRKIQHIKNALINGNVKNLSKNPNTEEAHLVKILLTLPELIHQKEFKENDKLWLKAKFYFLNRRFVEAAMLMSDILKTENNDKVRNWRARAIFFLGNPDLAINELKTIIAKNEEKSQEALDALYLIGAMIYESHDIEIAKIEAGITAWEKYLKLADADEGLVNEIKNGLAELKKRQKTTPFSIEILDPFSPKKEYGAEKNAILQAFGKDEFLLALELVELSLKKKYDADIATIKARIFFKTQRLDEAAELFTEIVTKNQRYAPGFHYRGMVFMLQGKPKEAIVSWQKTLELDENYGKSHGLLQRIAVAQKMVEPEKIETH